MFSPIQGVEGAAYLMTDPSVVVTAIQLNYPFGFTIRSLSSNMKINNIICYNLVNDRIDYFGE
jgi:hypothetical protein